MSTNLNRIAKLAKENRKLQFLSIAHLLTEWELLRAFRGLRKDASAGVDGVTYEEYRKDAWRRIQDLHQRIRNKRYRARPLRRVWEVVHDRVTANVLNRFKRLCEASFETLRGGDTGAATPPLRASPGPIHRA